MIKADGPRWGRPVPQAPTSAAVISTVATPLGIALVAVTTTGQTITFVGKP